MRKVLGISLFIMAAVVCVSAQKRQEPTICRQHSYGVEGREAGDGVGGVLAARFLQLFGGRFQTRRSKSRTTHHLSQSRTQNRRSYSPVGQAEFDFRANRARRGDRNL